ncbi:MAG TPA: hypothetical protein VFT61_06920 [Sphingomicrobium sp.]|nr:hypothetical protein [Sphingomicrobium sp.]
MRNLTKLLAGAAGLAAIAAATPAAAQYYNGYYGNSYNNGYYGNRYSNGYSGYGYTNGYSNGYVNASAAARQCSAAVQNRLYNRTSIGSILGSLVGINTNNARVLSITAERPTRNGMRIDGLASSGRMAYNNYGSYGVGAYGALGYNYAQQADLSFHCNVDSNGYVRSVKINRR